jgi:hypothetical protein
MFRTLILGLAAVATIAAITVAGAAIGTAAATYGSRPYRVLIAYFAG